MAQQVEHVLGKDEVTSSNLVSSSKEKRTNYASFLFCPGPKRFRFFSFFQICRFVNDVLHIRKAR